MTFPKTHDRFIILKISKTRRKREYICGNFTESIRLAEKDGRKAFGTWLWSGRDELLWQISSDRTAFYSGEC